MNPDWKVIAATLGIFAAGLVAGGVAIKAGERGRHAPFPMMHEFKDHGDRDDRSERWEHGEHKDHHRDGHDRKDGFAGRAPFLPPEFEKQMGDYHDRLRAVLHPYQDRIKAILTPAQQKTLEEAREEARGEGRERRAGGPGPGPGPDGAEGRDPEGGLRFIGMIVYRPILDRMSRDLALDAKQQAQLDAVFKERRAALLQFLDANPPPTIRMALGAGENPGPPAPPPPPPPPAPAPAPSGAPAPTR